MTLVPKLLRLRHAVVALALLVGAPATASATSPFPLTEGFTGTSASGWTTSGSAIFTANSVDTPGTGWLRLTPAQEGGFVGAAYNSTSFPSANGVLVSFDYAAWGYGGSWPRGADGTSVFLYDASQPFSLGSLGGGLGYAGCFATPGLNGGYVGIGLDEYGNYANSNYCGRGVGNGAGSTELPNWVGVRGPTGLGAPWLGGAPVPAGKTLEATRPSKIQVTVAVADDKAYTWLQYADGSRQVVLNGVALGGAAPSDLKVGFAASTGGSNNNHEVRSVKVALPVDLSATATQQPSPGGRERVVNWDVTVSNSNLNSTDDAPIALRGNGLTDIAWTCSNGTGGTCDAASGSGLAAGTVDLAAGGTVTYHVSAKITGSADTADLGFEVLPGPANGELSPADNVGSTPVVLTPIAATPAIAHAPNGVVTTTEPAWLGGSLTTTREWQRCEPDGTACVTIPGANGLSYTVDPQDAGKTLRAVFTATNAAGTTTLTTTPLTLPDSALSAGPAQRTSLATATFAFGATGPNGTTLQCRLDGGAWGACASGHTVERLADGAHTFEVRAVYGGLPDPTPATWHWTVDTTAPAAPVVLAGPVGQTLDRSARIDVGTEPDATLECSIDGGAFTPCASPILVRDLALGAHTVAVRQVDAAGNVGPVSEHSWTVTTKPADVTTPATPTLDARISSRATVENGNTVGVGCMIAGDTVRSCTVDAYVTGASARVAHASAAKRVLVGTGTTTVTGAAKASVVVKVKLNAKGRALMRRAAGGLKVQLDVNAKLGRGGTRAAKLAATLLPRETVIVPVGPFGTARSAVRASADRIVHQLARDARGARKITCLGHTDARGGSVRNWTLGKQRAEAVCRKLRRLGVKAKLVVRSAGESQPRATNATAAGMQRNRRVEVRVDY